MVEFKADHDRFGRAHSGVRDPHACQYGVFHTTENSDTTSAISVADWQLNTANGSSYNLLIGTDGITVRSNSDRFTPWSAGSPGNRKGLHMSAIGYAARDRAHWLRFPAQIESLARIAADWHRRYGLPLVWLSPADIRAGRRGFTSHQNVYQGDGGPAFRSDPGAGFPHDIVLQRARDIANPEEGFLMALSDAEQRELLDKVRRIHHELTYGFQSRYVDPETGEQSTFTETLVGYALEADKKLENMNAVQLPAIREAIEKES